MLDNSQIERLNGTEAYGSDGEKIGKVGQVYLDDQTGQPTWATVNTGLFGMNESFVPLSQASMSGDTLTVPYDKDRVKGAPNVASDAHLSPEEERNLYEYYGLSYSDAGTYDDTTTTGTAGYADTTTTGTTTTGNTGHDTSGPTTDEAMTRSEEQVRVGTESREAGRARLRKYVVTENVTQTVPVRREKAVLETEPITDANIGDATSGPDISEEEHEVVLREERPVVQKDTVPVERVRLGTEEVVSEETVTEEVRKERIEADGNVDNDITR
jgi:uncharacterized protein (TIGR02271 family)